MTHHSDHDRIQVAGAVLRDAVAHGLIDAADVATGRADVQGMPGHHRVRHVDVDGSAVAYIKHVGDAGSDTEAQTLQRLAGRAPVPALLAHPAGSVWTAPAPGVALGLLGAVPDLLDRAAAGLGRTLAELHWSVRDVNTPAARMPWPLRPRRPSPTMLRGFATAEPPPSTLRDAAASWRSGVRDTGTWIHGDVSATNVIVAGVGGDRPCRVTLIDLEEAGQGDPGWDVACAEATLAGLDRRHDQPAILIFRAAYAAAGGLGQPTVALRCVRDLMTTWQDAAARDHRQRARAALVQAA